MNKAILMAAALVLAPLPALSQEAPRSGNRNSSSVAKDGDRDAWRDLLDELSQSDIRDRLAGAIEIVEGACAADINDFCSKVMPGDGRLMLCMRAHEDQLSRRCQTALYRVSRNLERTVERIAETCWNDIQRHCGDADRIGQCVVEKRASLSSTCQTVVAALGQRVQGLEALRGMPVYSSDDKNLGQVVEVVRGADGKVQSIQVDIGRFLGIGKKAVTINADKFEQQAGRIKVLLSDAEVRSLPEAKKQ